LGKAAKGLARRRHATPRHALYGHLPAAVALPAQSWMAAALYWTAVDAHPTHDMIRGAAHARARAWLVAILSVCQAGDKSTGHLGDADSARGRGLRRAVRGGGTRGDAGWSPSPMDSLWRIMAGGFLAGGALCRVASAIRGRPCGMGVVGLFVLVRRARRG
jgi:hypothetical protein